MKKIFVFVLASIALVSFRQDKPAYQLYNLNGSKVRFSKMIVQLAKADIILFGEMHDNPICHWMELQVSKELSKEYPLVMAAEMFETDLQLMLDELMAEQIREKDFESQARLWPNYKTDYKPLLKFALDNKIRMVASNVPRRYAAMVSSGGLEVLEGLSGEAKQLLPPLPIPYVDSLPGYKSISSAIGGHGPAHIAKAQALKDATMAWNIVKNHKEGGKSIHFNGTYHSENFEGIVWYLNHYAPQLKVMTIASITMDTLQKPDESEYKKADFLLVVPSDMTKTY
ncbi:MAG: ChaN family lipoprotein [Bacteroidales bacterium]|nr:ChaN family lipoprotein [Bacteroidales bacterium]